MDNKEHLKNNKLIQMYYNCYYGTFFNNTAMYNFITEMLLYSIYEVAEYKVGLLMMFNNIGKYNINQK